MKYEREVSIKDSKLVGLLKDEVYSYVKSCVDHNKRVWLTLESFSRLGKTKRSTKQNSYYWKFFVTYPAKQLTLDTGQNISPDDLHEHLKDKFLKKELILSTGEIIETNRSTTDLTTKEFTDYLEQIKEYMLESFSIDIYAFIHINSMPYPEKYITSNFN